MLFLELAKMAVVVVACRVIPSQKADLVKLIRYTPLRPMTLAIGDGANDVSMIQEAHVGVGISGNEGMQAVRASDYSLSQFRFLQRLLFVHGRWDYHRIATLILYSFYKNMTFVLTLFLFGLLNGFSGTTLYESWLGTGWNVAFTLFPIFFYAFFEADLTAECSIQNPTVYLSGQRQTAFNVRRMAHWIGIAIAHAVVIFLFPYMIFKNELVDHHGQTAGLFLFGTIVNFCAVITVTLKIALESKSFNKWTAVGMIGSIVVWIAFVAVYSQLLWASWDFYGIAGQLFTSPAFYFVIILVPTTCILIDLVQYHIQKQYFPTPVDIVREKEVSNVVFHCRTHFICVLKIILYSNLHSLTHFRLILYDRHMHVRTIYHSTSKLSMKRSVTRNLPKPP